MSTQNIGDMIEFLTSGRISLKEGTILMPLTSSLKVTLPEDVIGFISLDVSGQGEPNTYTFEGRAWEDTAEFTGLTAESYVDHLIDVDSVITVLDDALILSASSRLAWEALDVMGIKTRYVFQLSNIYRLSETPYLLPKEDVEPKEIADLIYASNPPRKLSRAQWAERLKAEYEIPPGATVGETNVYIDKASLLKVI